ncbi:MAG: SDR family NAD(P)-dependent oxidoreductase, partial [Chloroflexi bacterium]|nr:SDR family NAD(P)-dependent oxidoreductase [Chloroflexota bacterium]
MNRLLDKVAVVPGAGGGIGLGVARRFAAEGAKVVIAELNESTGKCAANEIESEFGTRVLFVKTDVSQKEDILAMVDATVHHFERVDILVNNAWGGGQLSRLEYKTTALMERALRVG